MKGRNAYLFAVLLAAVAITTGCNKSDDKDNTLQGTVPKHLGVAVQIQLQLNGDGSCSQIVGGASTPYVPLGYGDQAVWAPVNAVPFYIQFQGASPFYNSFGNPNGTPATSTPAVGPSGTTYSYSSVIINGNSCNNPSQLGFRMK